MSELQLTTTPTPALPVAGWYDDPVKPGYVRYWTGATWGDVRKLKLAPPAPTPAPVVVLNNRKTSHGFHLFMTIITFGLWTPVWVWMSIYNKALNNHQ